MEIGYFGLVLHGHMPYMKKAGMWPFGMENLFEAINETYIPMLDILRELKQNNVNKVAITINITPILIEQLADDYLKSKFEEYMENLIQRAQSDIERYDFTAKKHQIATYYKKNFESILDSFHHNYYRDLIGSYKWLQDEGIIEIITSCATHGFLPLFHHESGIFSQIQAGVDTYKKYFNRDPKGFWLPECAYRPKEVKNGKVREGLDYWLNNSGIEYFFVDSHGILNAEILENKNDIELNTNYGYKLKTGVKTFGRNIKTSRQVWDSKIGYPGDSVYREFHKKDSQTGLHYWRITDKNSGKGQKEFYDPEKAQAKVKSQAHDFISLVEQEALEFYQKYDKKGIIVSPYDFELFGHWWFEGIDWLKNVFLLLTRNEKIEMITFSDFIEKYQASFSIIQMKESSWGAGGHFQVWNHEKHRWTWPYINSSIKDFENVLKTISNPKDYSLRVLKQIARELLLMESSDWEFLLYTKQAEEYANKRFHHHHQRFNKLIWQAKNFSEKNRISENELGEIEDKDSCFKDIDIDYFRTYH
jgi:1,4-alpha-glucan branching enzyme